MRAVAWVVWDTRYKKAHHAQVFWSKPEANERRDEVAAAYPDYAYDFVVRGLAFVPMEAK